jgi:hypothetical protein
VKLGYDEQNVFYEFIHFILIWNNRELHSDPTEVWRMILERNPDLKAWWDSLEDFYKVEIMKRYTE